MFARFIESIRQAKNRPVGRHFQGDSFCLRYPGLKPWAMIYNRFAVNPTRSQGFSHGFSFQTNSSWLVLAHGNRFTLSVNNS